ncbi:DUF397 domain-containing protein [Actinomadura parmotrematis]|uniref:DUF397 domain-containing protein n=1 Tax=Actinomadura parmotrematis TaxID=2864039 RepID=UPI0027E2F65B|nr:DUF397 domain-containing protein [Actinomadura parmotrematis]
MIVIELRRSSFGDADAGGGGACAELAVLHDVVWRKSSFSGDDAGGGGTCVEPADLCGVAWRKSARSEGGTGGTCVKLAVLHDVVGVRDSTSPQSGHLTIGRETLTALLDRIKSGVLDL